MDEKAIHDIAVKVSQDTSFTSRWLAYSVLCSGRCSLFWATS
jgi:hypothetical protein